MPWVHKGKIKVRQVTTLGLSFDHRIIDGELGSKFLRDVGRLPHRSGGGAARLDLTGSERQATRPVCHGLTPGTPAVSVERRNSRPGAHCTFDR